MNICYTVPQFFKNFIFQVIKKLTNVLEEATSSVSTIKMEEPTTSNFMGGGGQ